MSQTELIIISSAFQRSNEVLVKAFVQNTFKLSQFCSAYTFFPTVHEPKKAAVQPRIYTKITWINFESLVLIGRYGSCPRWREWALPDVVQRCVFVSVSLISVMMILRRRGASWWEPKKQKGAYYHIALMPFVCVQSELSVPLWQVTPCGYKHTGYTPAQANTTQIQLNLSSD